MKHNYFMWTKTSFHGGFTWPQRSYTCTFCRREFRSAQALGGHMNVHRRDRARLKQSPPAPRPESDPGLGPRGVHLSPTILSMEERRDDEEYIETRLSIGIIKRHKGSGVVSSPLPFLGNKACSSERCSAGTSMEADIDLELRLGDIPIIK